MSSERIPDMQEVVVSAINQAERIISGEEIIDKEVVIPIKVSVAEPFLFYVDTMIGSLQEQIGTIQGFTDPIYDQEYQDLQFMLHPENPLKMLENKLEKLMRTGKEMEYVGFTEGEVHQLGRAIIDQQLVMREEGHGGASWLESDLNYFLEFSTTYQHCLGKVDTELISDVYNLKYEDYTSQD